MRTIDFRSDTVTKPTPAMREAMAQAEVGDDVYGEDPAVNALEERLARLFGHEAALFCASGTMANQIAIKVHTRPGDEVICDEGAHIYRYEGGGIMTNSACSVKLIRGDRGQFSAHQVLQALNDPGNLHFPKSRLVCLENTANRGGGSIWALDAVQAIRQLCSSHGLALHMDGARLFNAMAADGTAPQQWGALLDSISICLSKGLGAPVGSVLTGTKPFIAEARRVRKRMGGGMRQAGILAAAGLFALDHHAARLKEDHRRAKILEQSLAGCRAVESVLPVKTNIVVATLAAGTPVGAFLSRLKESHILAAPFGENEVRFVLHLDVDDDAILRTAEALKSIA